MKRSVNMLSTLMALGAISGGYINAGPRLTDSTSTVGRKCKMCPNTCPPKRYCCSAECFHAWGKKPAESKGDDPK